MERQTYMPVARRVVRACYFWYARCPNLHSARMRHVRSGRYYALCILYPLRAPVLNAIRCIPIGTQDVVVLTQCCTKA